MEFFGEVCSEVERLFLPNPWGAVYEAYTPSSTGEGGPCWETVELWLADHPDEFPPGTLELVEQGDLLITETVNHHLDMASVEALAVEVTDDRSTELHVAMRSGTIHRYANPTVWLEEVLAGLTDLRPDAR